MKKRDKKLRIAKETLYDLEEGKDMKAILGGVDGDEELSCTRPPSTAGGSVLRCCG
jgi:hypothetical protein